MKGFADFYKDLMDVVRKYKQDDTSLRIEQDLEDDIVKIFGEKADALSKAKSGLDDVLELSYTTAEHHPYWNILYNCAQISDTVLQKWNANLDKDDVEEIKWNIKELTALSDKLSEHVVEN